MKPEQQRELETWAIEWALGAIEGRYVERRILEALHNPSENPVRVLREMLLVTGRISPTGPSVETWTKPGHITVWRDWGDDEPLMRISMARVVEYVWWKHSSRKQLSLF